MSAHSITYVLCAWCAVAFATMAPVRGQAKNNDGPSTQLQEQPNKQTGSIGKMKSKFGSRGGRIYELDSLRCEVVFGPRSIDVYLFDLRGEPISTKGVRGRISLKRKGRANTYRFDLYPRFAANNGLSVALDPNQLADRAATARIALYGVEDEKIGFAVNTASALTKRQLAIHRQAVCPVSGKDLPTLAATPALLVGKQEVFVCCMSCTGELRDNPKRYAKQVAQVLSRQQQRR